MRRMKRTVLALTAMLLVMPSFQATASTTDTETKDTAKDQDGYVASKDEVVYATLSPNGDKKKIYVVNTLDVTKAGEVIDYGAYSSLKNLTDLSELEQSGDNVRVTAPEGKFYYQGNLNEAPLPWSFSIAYSLDGEPVSPQELAGENGRLQIEIETSANKEVEQAFFENYLLQISLTFDAEKTDHIKAKDGMIANAGKDKQVTFTVMPEQEEELVVEADVEDFELDGIDITAVPSTMSIEPPDIDETTGDMKTLANAVSDINDGVADLKYGISELNTGTEELRNGSAQYNNGISVLDASSPKLVDGSREIDKALETMSSSLKGLESMDLSGIEELAGGLSQMSNGLGETATGLSTLKGNYAAAYQALDNAMEAMPAHDISQKDIQALYESGADKQTVDKLVETYTAARTAKGTYNEVKQAFSAVGSTLETVIGSLNEMANNIDAMVAQLSPVSDMDMDSGIGQLKEGIATLSANYKTFHTGLLEYTGGVSQLANSYEDLDNGIGELSQGTGELENGVGELHKGTTKLERSTSDMPEQMTKEIDEMIAEYDKSDFDAVSFVSPENENVYSVQFVLKTESIEYEESETDEEPVEEEKGFWARFKDLFS